MNTMVINIKKQTKKIMKPVILPVRNRYENLRSSFFLELISKKRHHAGRKIRVAFIAQMPELWDKQREVYRIMTRNSDFDVWMIIVPLYDLIEKNEEKKKIEYFISECTNKQYLLDKDLKKTICNNIKSFDYIFYPRPYDRYLPPILKSGQVVKQSKICYIPYATPEAKNTGLYSNSFFRNIYMGFMESSWAAEQNKTKYKNNIAKGRQFFLDVGYPPFEKCLQLKDECCYSRVLWTPRWTYKPSSGGGSHFFEYCNELTGFHWEEASFRIRPHPMMWDNFVKEDLITPEEIEEIRQKWNRKNIREDFHESVIDTFRETDILISDRSSVIPMFFLTGKPIIYCPYKINYGELFLSIMPGLYIANNWDELRNLIQQLLEKKDPLREVRKSIVEKHFLQNQNATQNIVQEIVKDYRNTCK